MHGRCARTHLAPRLPLRHAAREPLSLVSQCDSLPAGCIPLSWPSCKDAGGSFFPRADGHDSFCSLGPLIAGIGPPGCETGSATDERILQSDDGNAEKPAGGQCPALGQRSPAPSMSLKVGLGALPAMHKEPGARWQLAASPANWAPSLTMLPCPTRVPNEILEELSLEFYFAHVVACSYAN